MSKNIANFTNSSYGIGITEQLNRYDSYNKTNENNIVYISIYNRDSNSFINKKIKVSEKSIKDNKEIIVNEVINILKELL